MTRKENILLAILAAVNFTNIMDFMIMMPLQEHLVKEFHISPHQFSILLASYAITAGISSLVASFVVDRFDRKKVLLTAYAGFVAGTLACAFAPSYEALMGARIIAGLFGGLIGAQAMAIVGDTFPYEKRGRAMGALMSGFALASVAGVPGGLYLASISGWHVPFLAVGIMGIIILPLLYVAVPPMTAHLTAADRPGPLDVYKSVLGSRNQQLALLMMFTMIFSHFASIPFIAPYLEKNVGLTQGQIAIMYCLGGAVSAITSRVVGILSDKYGKRIIFSVFLLLSAIPVYLITNMQPMAYYYVYMVTSLFFIVANGRMVPAQALITSVVPNRLRGGFMNLNSSLQQMGVGLASFIAGIIVIRTDAGKYEHYEIVGYLGIAVSFLCMIIAQFVKPNQE